MDDKHDATAIMDMLARHAADDTMWNEPPLLFALGRTPEGAYGIAPARPWTTVMLEAFKEHRLVDVLEAFPDMMARHEQVAPGLDALWVALRVAFEDPQARACWFPGIAKGTEPCGIVLRTEAWAKPQPVDQVEIPAGSLADDAEAFEILSWITVTYDEQFCQVTWKRGEAAPQMSTWSFKGDFYRQRHQMQRVPKALRAMMRLSRSLLLQKRRRDEPTGV